jgi:hypothetical protein
MKKSIKINIYFPHLNFKGSDSWYVKLIGARLAEKGIKVNFINDLAKQDLSIPTMIEYFPQIVKEIPNDRKYIIDILAVPSSKRMWVEIIAMAKSPRKLVSNLIFAAKNPKYASTITKRGGVLDFKELQNHHLLLVRDEGAAKLAGITQYRIVPIMNPVAKKLKDRSNSNDIHIGTVGFATRNKNNDKIAELAQRLGVKATIIATISGEDAVSNSATANIAKELDKYKSDKIKVITEPLTDSQIEQLLSYCTHFIFAQDDTMKPSSAIRELAKYKKPIICTPSTQASEGNAVYVVKSLNEIDMDYLKRATKLTYPPDGAEALAEIIKEVSNWKKEKRKNTK